MDKTDKELLDFLDSQGNGIALVHDDIEHWCMATDGYQSLSLADGPFNFATNFMVPGQKFGRKTVREAIAAYMDAGGDAYSDAVNEAMDHPTEDEV